MQKRKRGRGKQFEADLQERFAYYESKRWLVLRKVDPPTRIVGPGRIIFLPNPFLDFVGTLPQHGGRAVFLEAKETHDHRLGLGASATGVTKNQLRNLRIWHHAGGISGVLWKHPSGVFLLPISLIDTLTKETGRKHIKADQVAEIFRCTRDQYLRLRVFSTLLRVFRLKQICTL